MTVKTFVRKFSADLRHAETGRGFALIDSRSYPGCVVVGEYPAYPLVAWAACYRCEEERAYGISYALSCAQQRLGSRLNAVYWGVPVFGSTGSYCVF